ncbi:MAG: 3-ketoacyl-ACP reductase [Treponema sp.]|jgi:NAD(P)-dependent dehydrogenase (short-subunit alcohol dehydrogenase family)|nr:3-ketoacyl-ACP reductase [Treponema sp.]
MEKKVAIVTGSRRGIGKGIAKTLGKNGYFVILSATKDTADDVVDEMRRDNIDCEYIKCNVSDTDDRRRLFDDVCSNYGRIDVVVNNAGVAPEQRRDLLEVTAESYDRVLGINSRSLFFMCQLAAKKMIAFKNLGLNDYMPRIINISSISAYTSSLNRGEYCISKAAISMTTMLFADKLAEYGIPVFEIRPGFIMTDMIGPSKDKFGSLIDQGITPIKRFGLPQDVGDAVLALCSGLLDFATGQIINADGGFHLRRL